MNNINWTIVIITLIISVTIDSIANVIKNIKLGKYTKEITLNVDEDKLEAIKKFNMR